MWTPLAIFIGAGLSASFALSALFMARQKVDLWYWALFVGVVGMAVGGFGYIIPEAVPHGDAVFIFSVLGMMIGVFISYLIHPIEPGYSEDARLILTQKRTDGLRLLAIGVTLTLILGTGLGYYLSTQLDDKTASGLMSTQFLILHNQERQAKALADMRNDLEAQKLKAHKDSLAYARILANQAKGLANQDAFLRNQKQVKSDLKKAQQRPVIIIAPAPKSSLPQPRFDLPEAPQLPPPPPRKGRRYGHNFDLEAEYEYMVSMPE